MKRQFGDYYLGLDMGTSSVGWAVTDMDYNLLKLNGKAMWGSRLFDAAETSQNMRSCRSARRRLARVKWRVSLLRELLAEEMGKVDREFFLRLKESRLFEEDKKESIGKYSIFGREGLMTDKEFYQKYPTIHHLKTAMLNNEREAFDIRLLYLAVAHILKHRGHFLFNNLGEQGIGDFNQVFGDLKVYFEENFAAEEYGFALLDHLSENEIKNILLDHRDGVKVKSAKLEQQLGRGAPKPVKELLGFLCGGTKKLSVLFDDAESFRECVKNSFSFKTDDFEKVQAEIEKFLTADRLEAISLLKAVYDWSLLANILQGQEDGFISKAMVQSFDEHYEDLRTLKDYLHRHDRKLFQEIFGEPRGKDKNYSSYVGSYLKRKGKERKVTLAQGMEQSDFCKYLRGKLKKLVDIERQGDFSDFVKEEKRLFLRIKNDLAFPKQRVKGNGVIPMQLHLRELRVILQNAEQHLSFLRQKDASGLTVTEKIIEIMKFRIPYYVGPLAGTAASRAKKRCWVVRRPGRILPWNFDQIVDKEKSAEEFIRNLIGKCTYLPSEDVLPRCSLLYTEFLARNELNNLSVNGVRLPVEIIQKIYDDLLLRGKGKLTKKAIKKYLINSNMLGEVRAQEVELSGVDDILQADLKPHKDFCRIFGEHYVLTHRDELEDIIVLVTIFGDETKMLESKIKRRYPHITAEQLREIKRLKYKDWGRLSKTLLQSEAISWTDTGTGEIFTIISAMRQNAKNLMEILSRDCVYGFAERIQEFNEGKGGENIGVTHEMLDKMYISPSVRRSLWQTMLISKEIYKIIGHAPKRIFVEMAREEGEKKRTRSRRDRLLDLYTSSKEIDDDLRQLLESKSEEDLRSNKLFLYFIQLGRCMYSGEKIDLKDLHDKNMWDRDHIFPRSKTKDDSLDNLVLVKSTLNREKTDEYPLASGVRQKMQPFWNQLLRQGLISAKKYERLTRTTPLTTEELAGFISRQLVETRQSTKAAAELLKLEFPKTEVVYSKAGNVSDFRQEFDLLKCREINNLHHAQDAYLNIVVGNAYHVKFTCNPYNFVKKLREKGEKRAYSLKTRQMFAQVISRGEEIAWQPEQSMATVKHTMGKHNMLVTKMPIEETGQLYDLQLVGPKNKLLPIKKGLPTEKYGGYNTAKTAYFVLVESEGKKGKKLRTVEAVPVYLAKEAKENPLRLLEYLQSENGLVNPVIRLKKILKNSLLELDGCRYWLTGTTGKQLSGKFAVQLVLPKEQERYSKKLGKFAGRLQKNKNAVITKYDGITADGNQKLFDLLLDKQKMAVYRCRPASFLEVLERGRNKFEELPVETQCKVLSDLIDWISGAYATVDLTMLGGVAKGGNLAYNKNIMERKTAKLINYSVTGIFSQTIDLQKI